MAAKTQNRQYTIRKEMSKRRQLEINFAGIYCNPFLLSQNVVYYLIIFFIYVGYYVITRPTALVERRSAYTDSTYNDYN